MIDLAGIMGIPFLKKSRFTGSDGSLRFVLEKRPGETAGTEDAQDVLAAVCWRGPYASEATPEEEKTVRYFPFDACGLSQAQDWLNEQARDAGKEKGI